MEQKPADAIVLADAEGNYYVLPREIIELTKVSPEAKESVNAHIDREVSGFAQVGSYSLVGRMVLPAQSQWAKFSPGVGWPYYRPGIGTVTDRINPAR